MIDKLRFLLNRLKEQLWVKPLVMSFLSIFGVFLAKGADRLQLERYVPGITVESVETLLKIIAASMLVMAIFAVGSMVSAYASASSSATPRAFPLVIADDVSQNALSVFIGAFIFSLVGLFALLNSFYGRAGLFTLLLFTTLVFVIVILTFLRWVDRIARLGRLGATIEKVESATATAMERRRNAPTLQGSSITGHPTPLHIVHANSIGYVQQVNVGDLQAIAEELDGYVQVAALPGTFASPSQPLAYISHLTNGQETVLKHKIASAFIVGKDRTFEDDPRFGLVVLSEIAGRALSPGINDPGSAISVIGSLVRLLVAWSKPSEEKATKETRYDRVMVPELCLADMFDDAFTAIARDGAGSIEVVVRLQKGLAALAASENRKVADCAKRHSQTALARAKAALELPQDFETALKSADFAAGS